MRTQNWNTQKYDQVTFFGLQYQNRKTVLNFFPHLHSLSRYLNNPVWSHFFAEYLFSIQPCTPLSWSFFPRSARRHISFLTAHSWLRLSVEIPGDSGRGSLEGVVETCGVVLDLDTPGVLGGRGKCDWRASGPTRCQNLGGLCA